MKVLFLTGNEPNHNYFVRYLIDSLKIEKYLVLKHHSGLSDSAYFTRIYAKEKMLPQEEEYLRNFILERNKGFREYAGMIFENEYRFSNITNFNAKLDAVLEKEKFNYIFSYGAPLLNNEAVFCKEQKTVNFHFGLSRYYRGGSTNIYALANNEFAKVGLTAHKLERKVDGGGVLFEISLDGVGRRESLQNLSELNEFLLRKGVSRLAALLKAGKVEYRQGEYSSSPLILNKRINIEWIMKAESNLKKVVSRE